MTDRCGFDATGNGTVRLTGPMTFHTVPGLFREMETGLQDPDAITTIDLAAVPRADSAGLALLLEWQSRQHRRGRQLTMTSAPESLMRLAKLCESVELLNLSGRGAQP
jgi:phospholipid transport system transporter-binding protein